MMKSWLSYYLIKLWLIESYFNNYQQNLNDNNFINTKVYKIYNL